MLLAIAAVVAGAIIVLEQDRLAPATPGRPPVKVFLDCSSTDCFEDYLREEVEIVEYVRDRSDADVHVLVTAADTGARGREFTLAFIGQGSFAPVTRTLTVTSEASDPEDRVRRALATALTVGLLNYVAPSAIPPTLSVSAEVEPGATPAAPADDPWGRWIFSLNGDFELDAEESQRERNWGFAASADRITPDWKISIGSSFNQTREEFDLDEDEPFAVERRSRSFSYLVVGAAGEHWSVGSVGEVQSSTFENIERSIEAAPAVEWNFFPYSMYTRRQLRVQYSLGIADLKYYELTLYGKTEETRGQQELSITYEQREPWGTLEGRAVGSNYFPGFSQHRLSIEGEATVRILRGFSLSIDASLSRIRDQLSLPRREATPEEVLLRLRQLQSGFETRVEIGLQYQFGSQFAAIVNPRFGQ